MSGRTKDKSIHTKYMSGRTNYIGGRTKDMSGRTKYMSGRTKDKSIRTKYMSARTNYMGGRTKVMFGRTKDISGRTKDIRTKDMSVRTLTGLQIGRNSENADRQRIERVKQNWATRQREDAANSERSPSPSLTQKPSDAALRRDFLTTQSKLEDTIRVKRYMTASLAERADYAQDKKEEAAKLELQEAATQAKQDLALVAQQVADTGPSELRGVATDVKQEIADKLQEAATQVKHSTGNKLQAAIRVKRNPNKMSDPSDLSNQANMSYQGTDQILNQANMSYQGTDDQNDMSDRYKELNKVENENTRMLLTENTDSADNSELALRNLLQEGIEDLSLNCINNLAFAYAQLHKIVNDNYSDRLAANNNFDTTIDTSDPDLVKDLFKQVKEEAEFRKQKRKAEFEALEKKRDEQIMRDIVKVELKLDMKKRDTNSESTDQ